MADVTRLHRWAFLERKHIPDITDPARTYLSRLRIVQTPLGGLYLHAIRENDGDRHLHDHPWAFATLILRGGYTEDWLPDNGVGRAPWPRRWGRLSVHRIRRGEFHFIRRLDRRPTWTLVLVGRRRSDWGYLTPQGWVQNDDYYRRRRSGELAPLYTGSEA